MVEYLLSPWLVSVCRICSFSAVACLAIPRLGLPYVPCFNKYPIVKIAAEPIAPNIAPLVYASIIINEKI